MRRIWVNAGVAAALIAGGAALLLPAIAKVREAATRSKCYCHHKCLGVALHSYAEGRGCLPSGTVELPGTAPERRLSWVVGILPYIERERELKRFDRTLPADAPANLAAVEFELPTLICPSSGVPTRDADHPAPPISHVVAVAGIGPGAADLPANHPRAGVIGTDRGARLDPKFGDIPDGTSNTLLIAEVSTDIGPWARGGRGTLRDFDPAARPHVGTGGSFGGFHLEGVRWFGPSPRSLTAALADGSVRTITSAIDSAVLEALATQAGGEPVADDW